MERLGKVHGMKMGQGVGVIEGDDGRLASLGSRGICGFVSSMLCV